MKCLLGSVLLIYLLPLITPYVHKKVKIFVPTRVQHIHHTKVVKVPEYHHYFHDRKQSYPKPPEYNVNDFRDFDSHADRESSINGDDQFIQSNGYNNVYDFDNFPEQTPQHFDDRTIAMSAMPARAKAVKSGFQYSVPHSYLAYAPKHYYRKNSVNDDRYHPQHFYHQVGNQGVNQRHEVWLKSNRY